MYGYTNTDVYGARVAIDRGRLTQVLSPIGTSIDYDYDASVGWDGSQFVATHQRDDGGNAGARFLRRIGADGTPVGSASSMLAAGSPAWQSVMAWNGSAFLLAAIDGGNPQA